MHSKCTIYTHIEKNRFISCCCFFEKKLCLILFSFDVFILSKANMRRCCKLLSSLDNSGKSLQKKLRSINFLACTLSFVHFTLDPNWFQNAEDFTSFLNSQKPSFEVKLTSVCNGCNLIRGYSIGAFYLKEAFFVIGMSTRIHKALM